MLYHPDYKPTEALRVWVKAVTEVPFPVKTETWTIPKE